jgi:glycosyltransferase involved in cell wall biosynthesis
VLVVSTDRLARLAGSYNGHVRKIENCVNFDLLTGVAPPVPVKEVVIGFAGTPHRERDFQFVTPALERLLSRYGDKVKLHFMGFVPETLADRPEVVFEDFRLDYSAFFRRLASSGWHVGLAPLEDCESKFAKSDVKFKEYAACRIAGVYSDVPPYQGVIDSQLGLRVRNEADDWYEAIRRLVDDRDLTDGITARAFAHVRRNWGMERAAMEWQAVLGEILPASETRGAVDDRAMEGSLARFERLRDGRTTGPGRLLQVVKRRVQDSPRLYGLLRGIKHRLLKP